MSPLDSPKQIKLSTIAMIFFGSSILLLAVFVFSRSNARGTTQTTTKIASRSTSTKTDSNGPLASNSSPAPGATFDKIEFSKAREDSIFGDEFSMTAEQNSFSRSDERVTKRTYFYQQKGALQKLRVTTKLSPAERTEYVTLAILKSRGASIYNLEDKDFVLQRTIDEPKEALVLFTSFLPIYGPFTIYTTEIMKFVTDPSFDVLLVQDEKIDDRTSKVVSWKCIVPDPNGGNVERRGRFVFDIENGWALLESEDAVGQVGETPIRTTTTRFLYSDCAGRRLPFYVRSEVLIHKSSNVIVDEYFNIQYDFGMLDDSSFDVSR